jgi:hypothetical protein
VSDNTVAYWRLTPVTAGEARGRHSAAPVYCAATTELLHVRGGPDTAIGTPIVHAIQSGSFLTTARRAAEAGRYEDILREIRDLAAEPASASEWEEVRKLIAALAEVGLEV